MSDMWVDPADDPRTAGNPEGEKATLREYLDDYRLTLEMKCGGLDAEQLARRSVPPSTLSLLGLIRHLARRGGVCYLEGADRRGQGVA